MVALRRVPVVVNTEQLGRVAELQIALIAHFPHQHRMAAFANVDTATGHMPAGHIGMADQKWTNRRIERRCANVQRMGPAQQEPQRQQATQNPLERATPVCGLGIETAGFLPLSCFADMYGTMFRLAHMSDIHLGPLPRVTPRELASKRITGYVNWHRNRRKRLFGNILDSLMDEIKAAKPDHLVMTGDMVNLAAAAEIKAIARWLAAAGDPSGISLVPGNHDAYVPGAFKKTCAAWRPYMLGDDGSRSVSGDNLFPFLRRRGPVALIGVSTATATPPFMASGVFGHRQAERLATLLENSADFYRVILIHHPPVRGATNPLKRMIGIGRFSRVLQRASAELVLHGHTHEDTLYWLDGRDRRVPVVGVPAASESPGGRHPASGYNLITIDRAAAGWNSRLQRFGLNADASKFEALEETTLV